MSESRSTAGPAFPDPGALVEALPHPVWAAGPDLERKVFNRRWLEYRGRDAAQEQGRGWMEGIHPDDRERYLRIHRNAFAAREPYEVEVRLRGADGAYRWFLEVGSPWRDDDGVFRGFTGSCLDIDAHKRTEGLLVAAAGLVPASGERGLELLLRHLGEAIGADAVGASKCRAENPGRVRTVVFLLDGTQQPPLEYDLQGTPCAGVLDGGPCTWPSGVCQRFPDDAPLAALGAEGYAGAPLKGFDGKPIGILWAAFRRRIDFPRRTDAFLALCAEIISQELERERHERRLRKSESRFKAIFEQASVGIAQVDARTGAFELFNDAYARLLGRTREELARSTFADVTHPDDLEADLAWLERLKRGEIPGYTLEKRYLRPDGEVVHALLSVTAMGEPEEPVSSHIAVVKDITELRAAQEEEARLRAELETARRIEALGRLAGGVAHDFNNLLAVVQGYADILRLEGPRPDQAKPLEEIHDAAERGASLTRQLLAFGRRQNLLERDVDVNELIRGLSSMLRRLIGERYWIEADLTPELPLVHIDPAQLEQALVNLVLNARDAMPEGGSIHIATAQGPDDYALVRVRDSGTGISDEVRRHIFEPFFTTKPRGKGTGLGLSTVHGIVHQSGGSVEVDTSERGTIFTLRLPGSKNAERSRPPGRRILLVEGDDALRRLTTRVLTDAGFDVLPAKTRADAHRTVAGGRAPSLLITEKRLPDGDGEGLVEALRHDLPDLCVLVLSETPCDEPTLLKPFGPRQLRQSVERALAARPRSPSGAALS